MEGATTHRNSRPRSRCSQSGTMASMRRSFFPDILVVRDVLGQVEGPPMHFRFRAERAHRLTDVLAIRGQADFRECCPLRAPAA